jgi:hypothetical protein
MGEKIMGLFSNYFILEYKNHKVEVESFVSDLSKLASKFRLIVDDEPIDEVECSIGRLTLHAKPTGRRKAIIIVLIKNYFWATAYVLDGEQKLKMKRGSDASRTSR